MQKIALHLHCAVLLIGWDVWAIAHCDVLCIFLMYPAQVVVVCREEFKQHWEQQKQDSAATKQRRKRMDQRMNLAHANRVAQALAKQWPAHFGITRQDVVATVSFVVSMSCIAWCWTGQSLSCAAPSTDAPEPIMNAPGANSASEDLCKKPE